VIFLMPQLDLNSERITGLTLEILEPPVANGKVDAIITSHILKALLSTRRTLSGCEQVLSALLRQTLRPTDSQSDEDLIEESHCSIAFWTQSAALSISPQIR